MPTYEYECEACGHAFEEFQMMSEEPLKKCPKCGKKKLRRLFGTGAALLFKGSGFYETDYRSESYTRAAQADQTPAPSTDSSATPAAPAGASGAAGASSAGGTGAASGSSDSGATAAGGKKRGKSSRSKT
jgi:putative FmdB family regulatory protein